MEQKQNPSTAITDSIAADGQAAFDDANGRMRRDALAVRLPSALVVSECASHSLGSSQVTLRAPSNCTHIELTLNKGQSSKINKIGYFFL